MWARVRGKYIKPCLLSDADLCQKFLEWYVWFRWPRILIGIWENIFFFRHGNLLQMCFRRIYMVLSGWGWEQWKLRVWTNFARRVQQRRVIWVSHARHCGIICRLCHFVIRTTFYWNIKNSPSMPDACLQIPSLRTKLPSKFITGLCLSVRGLFQP